MRVDNKITHVLVSVSDVTARVDLAAELQASQSQAQGQIDTLLGILHVDPAQLTSFLSDSDAAMKMINSVLREPAREEGAFRKKLDTLFRLVTLGSDELQKNGYSRTGRENVVGPMPPFGPIIKSSDDLFKIIAFIRSHYDGDPSYKYGAPKNP